MAGEKPSSWWGEKPKFKEFDYFGRLHKNLWPTKANRKDHGIIAWFSTVFVAGSLILLILKGRDSSEWPTKPGDRGYESLSDKVAKQDAEYRKTHGTQFEREKGVWDGNTWKAKTSSTKTTKSPVKVKNKTIEKKKDGVRRIKRIGA